MWNDLSGNGRDLTAFDNNAAPTMRRNALNGRAAIEFNGTSSLLKTYGSTFTISQPDTYFVVYKSLDSTGSHFVFDSTNSNVRQLVGLAGSVTEMYANIALNATTAYPFPNYQLWSGTFDGASSSIWKNGTQVGAGNAGGSALSGLAVGGLSTSAAVRLRARPLARRGDPLLQRLADHSRATVGLRLAESEVRAVLS